jgi:hypothetical protein
MSWAMTYADEGDGGTRTFAEHPPGVAAGLASL